MKIAIIGMGLIGGSLCKAASRAGYDTIGFDRNDALDIADSDLILVALPLDAVIPWIKEHHGQFKQGAVVVDTCGVKEDICRQMEPLAAGKGWTFVGGHPMAGKEQSGYAYSDARLFEGASMILTPYQGTPRRIVEDLQRFFGDLGFSRVLTTTPEHHDRMIAFTSQLSHVIASS